MFIDDICYIANVGDSRAIMSVLGGKNIFELSEDHKPESDAETKRITENGGKIYQTTTSARVPNNPSGKEQLLLGPHRVLPGRLSVSRTFGDIEAKLSKYGGNPNVIIAEPEITAFQVKDEYDYVVLG